MYFYTKKFSASFKIQRMGILPKSSRIYPFMPNTFYHFVFLLSIVFYKKILSPMHASIIAKTSPIIAQGSAFVVFFMPVLEKYTPIQ